MKPAVLEAPSTDEQAEYDATLEEAIQREQATPIPDRYVDGKRAAWIPQEGSQVEFMSCPLFECLYHGTRGPGKTDALLMDFVQHVGKGHGAAWRGILFRQTYPQLADAVAKSQKWFRQMFPDATFVQSGAAGRGMAWHFETGESLLFRWMKDPRDYWNYHGWEIPWIAWEELSNWPDDRCYKVMMTCCRSSHPGVPRKYRATTNPYGVGHNWIKERWRLHGDAWRDTVVITDSTDLDGDPEPPRAAIHGHLSENKILLAADPNYPKTIAAAATSQAQKKAWEDGDWSIVAGGMFDDVWSHEHNSFPRFEVPSSWRIDRSFDWGSSKPFSVGWWAESDGSDLQLPDGRWVATVPGDLFRVAEWYGWTGKPNEGKRMLAVDVAKGILKREIAWGWQKPSSYESRVFAGPADSSIYTVENGMSIARDMAEPVRIGGFVYPGVEWTKADKRPGSRVAGWEQTRAMLKAAHPVAGEIREKPGLFVVVENCPQWIRTVLSLPRDEIKEDDVDTDAEDHAADETRYRVRKTGQTFGQDESVGMQ